ncbi:MAG: pilin [Patescibacteria group bacterium]|nr:pilin [Patescibacteria group bacterium]MCL5093713.1 pilin [Patescibacteria group bacterium]
MKTLRKLVYVIPFLPQIALAEPLLNGLNDPNKNQANSRQAIEALVGNVQAIVLNTAGAIAVLMIVIGGVTYITSAGNEKQAQKGKQFLTYAIIGLLLVVLAKIILSIFARVLGGSYS